VLTISRLSRWSVNYYNDTANRAEAAARDRQAAGGGLGEYYSERDTRVPTWMVAGDKSAVGELVGLDGAALDGGFADTGVAGRWLDDGIAPNGASGQAFVKESVHGFDLTFAAPKSVSLLRALSVEDSEKAVLAAHQRGIEAAMTYLHDHAGYTRVHNPLTGNKDLQRLPGLVGIAYQHETSRCGDPHLHTHVLLPNRQARTDGTLVSIDSKSLYHEARAAGIVYQAVVRNKLWAEIGAEWVVDEHCGMGEIAGITKRCRQAWSRRSSQLRDWASINLVVEGEATAQQLATAQKATRPKKAESVSWAELTAQWRADARGLEIDRAAHTAARAAREAARQERGTRAERLARGAARIGKSACTRADLVELLGAQIPVDAAGDPRALIEQIVDTVAVPVSAPRAAHHREGHQRYTVQAVIVEEKRIFEMVDETSTRGRLDLRAEDLDGLSADQARAICAIAASPYLVQPLQAPAGAGKTHSLQAVRAAAHRANKNVLVIAPTGKAVDEAMRDGAGDRGETVAKALHLIEENKLHIDHSTVIVADEASMVGTQDLKTLLEVSTAARAKLVLVGDAHQLAPVKARGGMFELLCDELPWTQRLSEVWRLRDSDERHASLGLRSGRGNRLRKAVGWYRNHDRLHTGDAVAMAQDATTAYITARRDGRDAAIICDRWEMTDAINEKLHHHYRSDPDAPTVAAAREHQVGAGDIIVSRHNDATIAVAPGPEHRRGDSIDQVRNGNRWRVALVDEAAGLIAAERLSDKARVIFEGDYRREHVTLGYATTVHAAQGMTVGDDRTAGVCWTVLSDRASRAMAYVGMTRARDDNHLAIYPAVTNEADRAEDGHQMRRGTKHDAAAALHTIVTANDDRPRAMIAEAAHADRALLPGAIAGLLDDDDERHVARSHAWRRHTAAERAREAVYQSFVETSEQAAQRRTRSRGQDQGYGLEL
jgi:conjugative relaxase-like TrwC/TraI family protein